MFDQEQVTFLQGQIAAVATTEDEAVAIVSILKETNWMPLIEKEQEQAKKLQVDFEMEKTLWEAHKKAHESDRRRCQYCYKEFLCSQLKYPRLPGKDLRSIPKHHRLLCCKKCRGRILEFYTRTCRVCGEKYIANNSQQTCKKCWGKDQDNILRQLKTQLTRARKANKPATLTITEWRKTIEHFQGICAYCRCRPFEELDHFIPISLDTINNDNGTTPENCVPACTNCNGLKQSIDPDDFSQLYRLYPFIKPNDIERVRTYLKSQTTPTDTYSMSQ